MVGDVILAAGSNSSSGGSYVFLLVIVALFGLLYFVTIRPQRNRQRRVMQTQREITAGAWVRTTAGMYATVTAVDGEDVILEIAPGVEVRYLRRAVMEVVSGGMEAPAEPAEDETEEEQARAGAQDAHGPENNGRKPADGTGEPDGAAQAEEERPAG